MYGATEELWLGLGIQRHAMEQPGNVQPLVTAQLRKQLKLPF
jgi:hypothetical protein